MWIVPKERFNQMEPGLAREVKDADGEAWIDYGCAKKATKDQIKAAKEGPVEKDLEGPEEDKAVKNPVKSK